MPIVGGEVVSCSARATLMREGAIAERARIRKELEKEVEENKQDMIEGEPVEDEWLRVGLLLAALDRICPKEPSDG